MPGEAITDNFMLGTATIMVGPVADLMALNPEDHSIGLVKDVTFKSDPKFVELTQGVKNTLVASVMNGNDIMIDGQMFEYTPRNVGYALSLNGDDFKSAATSTTVATAYVAPVDPAKLGATALVLASVASLAAGGHLMVQPAGKDSVQLRKIVAIDVATKTVTLNAGLPTAVGVGAKVSAVSMIPVGASDDQPYLSAKIVGTLSNGDVVTLLVPKVRFSTGISMAFKTDNFESMPATLKVFDLVSTDPFYADFQHLSPEGGPAKAQLFM